MGTIILIAGGVVVAAAAFVAGSYWSFNRAIEADVGRLEAAALSAGTVVTAERVAVLSEPVQRYLRWSGVVGRSIPSRVRLEQKGRIRSAPDAGWMNLEAEEFYSTGPPAFVWRAWFPRRGTPFVLGRDEYLGGEGSILMKMAAVFPVADQSGAELRVAGLMRYLNEVMWFPAAFAGDNVRWRAVDGNSAEVTIADRGMTATATMFFDGEGRPVNFVAQRYNTDTRRAETWETPIADYGVLGGLNLPIKGKAVWKLAGGDFTYIELEITGVAYDDAARQQ
jgi:hypothetical protein